MNSCLKNLTNHQRKKRGIEMMKIVHSEMKNVDPSC